MTLEMQHDFSHPPTTTGEVRLSTRHDLLLAAQPASSTMQKPFKAACQDDGYRSKGENERDLLNQSPDAAAT